MEAELSWGLVVLLAVVQGVTEFLPISSSAHLLLPSQLFGLPDQGLLFDTCVHGGTLIGVTGYYRRDVAGMLRACVTRAPARGPERLLAGWLLVASMPVLATGFLLADYIETQLRTLPAVAWATVLFALPLWWAARRQGWRGALTARIILLAGLAQVLALIPGVSRSGITLTAGLGLGLSAVTAARLAFLLAIPVIAAAFGYGVWQLILQDEPQQLLQAAVAALLAALFSYLTITFFLRVIAHVGIMPFVIYRLALGAALLCYWWLTGVA